MKKGKTLVNILFVLFVLTAIVGSIFGFYYIYENVTDEEYTFTNDGYAVLFDEANSTVETKSFTNGTVYQYKKHNDDVTFKTSDETVELDENNIIHYQNSTYVTLNNAVGIDLNNVDEKIILYYNINKNNIITNNKNKYTISSLDSEVTFSKLLIRLSDTKFMLLGENICLITENDELVSFGDYVYFDYGDNNVINVYDENKAYKTISSDSKIVSGNVSIDLSNKRILKENTAYITLSNLVIDMDSNIDLIPLVKEGEDVELEVEDVDVDDDVLSGNDAKEFNNASQNAASSIGSAQSDATESEDETVVEEKEAEIPKFNVTEFEVNSLQVNAKIEITDNDSTLISDTEVSIVENSTNQVVYPNNSESGTFDMGTLNIYISYAGLSPDTEYTLYAKATYQKDNIEYPRTFVSKIFRTSSLGVTMKKGYATSDSIEVDIHKENYSQVTSAKLSILDEDKTVVNYSVIDLSSSSDQTILFDSLDNNTKYTLVLSNIYSNGTSVDDKFKIEKEMSTLKKAPTIGNLEYSVDKKNSLFTIGVDSVKDDDYSITAYRYEIYDARQNIDETTPIISLEKDNASKVSVNVDEIKLYHGINYVYKLIVVTNDNDKVVEYSYTSPSTMCLDGVQFPTVRFTETNVTWEQINGAIMIDDPSSAIVGDKFKVIYKNSLGSYTALTTTFDTDTSSLPISINGLRANETYTFDVYASLDLQDGNGTTENVYIGSVTCQTDKPKTLSASFTDNNDYTNLFSVNLNLQNDEAELEASTISEMRLTLYEGSTTNGDVAIWTRVVDTNTEDYVSTIKQAFYDQATAITPSTFNAKNSAFTSKVYTLKISDVYDYTTYKNEIPIENGTYSFQINSVLPSLPEDVNDAIEINEIKNKFATSYGLTNDTNLDPNTVVGYSLTADFDNSAEYGQQIEYSVYMYSPSEDKFIHVEKLDKTVAFDGISQKSAVYSVGYGTDKDLDLDQMRRGNQYYFTYKVLLKYDSDSDGKEEEVYFPEIVSDGVVLRSVEVTPMKQMPSTQLYFEKIRENSTNVTKLYGVLKYKIKDLDNAIIKEDDSNKYLYLINGNESSYGAFDSKVSIETNSSSFNSATFYTIEPGKIVNLKIRHKRSKASATYAIENISSQYIEKPTSFSDVSFSSTISSNQLIITFDNYYNYADLFNRVHSMDIEVVPTDEDDAVSKITISNIDIDSNVIKIPLYNLYSLLGKEFKVNIKLKYDSGYISNISNEEGTYALQTGGTSTSKYYYFDSESLTLKQSTSLQGVYSVLFEPDNNRVKVDGQYFDISFDSTGIVYNNNNVNMKSLASTELAGTDTLKFDKIVPGINMFNETKNKVDLTALLDSVVINGELSWFDKLDIQDDKVYIELYKTDDDGRNDTLVDTYTKLASDFDSSITIENLEYFTNYYLQFYTYVNVDGEYTKTYLYDVYFDELAYKYRFKTLTDVEISDFSASLQAVSYSKKTLNISYSLKYLEGYDHISYRLYKCNDDYTVCEETTTNFASTSSFQTHMGAAISADPNSITDINYGGKYKVNINPVGKIHEGQADEREVSLGSKTFTFQIPSASLPSVAITPSKDDKSIKFRVTISDDNYTIKDGIYSYSLVNSQGVIVKQGSGNQISYKYRTFGFTEDDGLENGETYTFTVIFNTDTNNDGTPEEQTTFSKKLKFGDNIDIGEVVTSSGENDNQVMIYYFNSYKIDEVTNITYTVTAQFDDENSFSYTGSSAFNKTYNESLDAYVYTLNIDSDDYKKGYLYYITINYYDGSTLLLQDELSYFNG